MGMQGWGADATNRAEQSDAVMGCPELGGGGDARGCLCCACPRTRVCARGHTCAVYTRVRPCVRPCGRPEPLPWRREQHPAAPGMLPPARPWAAAGRYRRAPGPGLPRGLRAAAITGMGSANPPPHRCGGDKGPEVPASGIASLHPAWQRLPLHPTSPHIPPHPSSIPQFPPVHPPTSFYPHPLHSPPLEPLPISPCSSPDSSPASSHIPTASFAFHLPSFAFYLPHPSSCLGSGGGYGCSWVLEASQHLPIPQGCS